MQVCGSSIFNAVLGVLGPLGGQSSDESPSSCLLLESLIVCHLLWNLLPTLGYGWQCFAWLQKNSAIFLKVPGLGTLSLVWASTAHCAWASSFTLDPKAKAILRWNSLMLLHSSNKHWETTSLYSHYSTFKNFFRFFQLQDLLFN